MHSICFIGSFRSPPCASRCSYWFGRYEGWYKLPPPYAARSAGDPYDARVKGTLPPSQKLSNVRRLWCQMCSNCYRTRLWHLFLTNSHVQFHKKL